MPPANCPPAILCDRVSLFYFPQAGPEEHVNAATDLRAVRPKGYPTTTLRTKNCFSIFQVVLRWMNDVYLTLTAHQPICDNPLTLPAWTYDPSGNEFV